MGSDARPPVAIVIPNLDGAHWLTGCLRSLAAQTLPARQVIVADDGSIDDSAAVCAAFGASFLPATATPRTGFAATITRGIAAVHTDCKWIMLLNNDTQADCGFVSELVEAGRRYPEVGVLAPLVRSLRNDERIDSAGLLLYPDGVARPRWHGDLVADHPMREELVLLASGTAVMIRSEVLAAVGPLDLSLGSYLEDVDWGLRAARRGVATMFIPSAVVDHHFSGTFGAQSPTKARLVERNRVIVAARHLPLRMLLASPPRTLQRWRSLAASTAGSEAGVRTSALRGVGQGLLALPGALRQRGTLTQTVPAAAWLALLAAHSCGPEAFRVFGDG